MADKKRLFCLIVFGLFVFFSLASGVYALTANISLTETSWFSANKAGYWGGSGFSTLNNYTAPLPVFFEGWGSTPRDDIVNYQWDFGDGDKVNGSGQFNAFHVYEKIGTWKATLTVMNITGATNITNITIIVRNASSEYPNKIRYIDSVLGSDSYSGKSKTWNGTDGPWATADRAFANLSTGGAINNFQYLFNRGQTFTYTRNYSIASDIGIYFGAYGTGDKPIITPSGGYNSDILNGNASHAGINYLRFSDLEFRGGTGGSILSIPISGIYNTLFLRVNITGYYSPFIFQGMAKNDAQWTNSKFIDGVFLVDSYIYNSTNIGFSAFNVNKLAIINTTIDHSNNHNIYTSAIDRAVITELKSTRPAFGRAALRLAGGINATWPSQNIYIARNFFGGWIDPINGAPPHNGGGNRYNWLLVQFSPQSPATAGQSRDEVYYTIENNIFTNGELLLGIGSAENFTIRNNLFITNNTNSNGLPGTANLLQIGFSDAQAFNSGESDQKASKNINIIGNTFIQRNGATAIIKIENYSYNSPNYISYKNHQNISIKNNLFYLASGASGTTPIITISRNDPNLISNISVDNNLFFFESGSQTSNLFNIGQHDSNLGTSYNLAGWRALTSNDLNSIYENPLFSIYSTNSLINNGNYLDYDSFGPNLTLQSNSPAINKGTNLQNLLFYDYNGNLRDSLPDIGAFENVSGEIFSPSLPTCTDGIQNQGETGVDCGGSCAACGTGGGGGGGGGGPIESTIIKQYTNKDLTISGEVLNNDQSLACKNCVIIITFLNNNVSSLTDSGGNFRITFFNKDFNSGVHKINIKLIDNINIITNYQKEIYIT